MNVCARFRGSFHDSYIWNQSNILPIVQNLSIQRRGSYYLLGDSGYPLRPWMMTPLLQVKANTPEAAYNARVTGF